MVDHEELRKLGQRLCEVHGVVGVLLGGSRARGEHTRESDFDLGLYYRPPLDIDALEDLARDVAGPEASVSRPGEWGPWVDGVVLADPSGEITALQRATRHYPPRLRDALVAGLWEASFDIDNARKAVSRGDTTYVAGCLLRAVEVCAHALHGHAGHWLINEKGAVASTGRLPEAPARFAERAQGVMAHLGATPAESIRRHSSPP